MESIWENYWKTRKGEPVGFGKASGRAGNDTVDGFLQVKSFASGKFWKSTTERSEKRQVIDASEYRPRQVECCGEVLEGTTGTETSPGRL